jgi:hypothetical protein
MIWRMNYPKAIIAMQMALFGSWIAIATLSIFFYIHVQTTQPHIDIPSCPMISVQQLSTDLKNGWLKLEVEPTPASLH